MNKLKILGLALALTITSCNSTGTEPQKKEDIVEKPVVEMENKSSSEEEKAVETSSKIEKEETAVEEEKEEPIEEVVQKTDLEIALGHKPEYGTFELVARSPNAIDVISLNSDGTFTGSLSITEINNGLGEVNTYLAEYEGEFELGEQIEDKVYELKLVDAKLTSTPGETEQIAENLEGEYLNYIPHIDSEFSYRLILRGYEDRDLAAKMEFFETGTESAGFSDMMRLKTNVIVGSDGFPLFAEIIDYENVGEDFDIFAKIRGARLDSNFFASPQLMTSVEFDNDGYFTGSYFATSLGDEYDAGLSDVAATYGVNEIHSADFKGKFDLISDNKDGTYNLKIAELEITSTPGVHPERPYEAIVDFIRQWEIGDELILIEAGTHLDHDQIEGTALEDFLAPPYSTDDHDHDAPDDHTAYGLTLYNKTQDVVFTDWSID